MSSFWSAVFAGAINTDLSPSPPPPRVLYIHRRQIRSVDAQRCGASAEQSRGHFGILVIICIRPSGFRTAPRVASEKPWNAQSPAQAMSLRICLSVSLCVTPLCHHHPSTTKKKKKNARWWCLWALVRTHQSESSICVCCTPLADRWKPQAQRWGSLFWSTLPPASFTPPSPSCPLPNTSLPFFPLPLCTHQAEIKASISQSQAPEPGCRRWKPASVTTRRQISPCIWHNNTDREGKEAQMQYSYENYKAGSNVTWHCGT